ncbi:hypothetical protein MCEMIEM12_02087 [Burkholderiaceae bacterium]
MAGGSSVTFREEINWNLTPISISWNLTPISPKQLESDPNYHWNLTPITNCLSA